MDENELKKILENYGKRISDLENLIKSKPTVLLSDGETIIIDLISSGFFDVKKKLSDVTKELKFHISTRLMNGFEL